MTGLISEEPAMGQAGSVRNGGEVIVEYLVREKVPYVFGLCGHGNVGLLDALYDRTDAIRTISTRHEQTAGHMADAFFRGRIPPGRHAHLVRAGIGEHSHQHRGRPDRGSGISGTRGIRLSEPARSARSRKFAHGINHGAN
jgi:Thiamine pyrophosphate enzyme, N-terminal TPP binding domain